MRNTGIALLVLVSVGVASCIAPEEPEAARRSAIGEPTNGFPTAAERLGIMAINRARSDPQTVKGAASASYRRARRCSIATRCRARRGFTRPA